MGFVVNLLNILIIYMEVAELAVMKAASGQLTVVVLICYIFFQLSLSSTWLKSNQHLMDSKLC